ncbi:23S rRNA (uracil(1939)-C(5))-methyltransferase RlmD [[Clostridium] polysaccharolyticum]|uniref:23S rRNA (Uracil-5-)-methyltransferase RumA n=1 Tax=[Clostridium] polysaccharolyticum TaxID=29364 RepID=A0A1I0EX58_9FIRM|nr:23S rRNA (uracil(1939)-C(5))-methyltransferase RlmD [[Clostridium] polysaccharolyticum]SET50214.1 23S rRNA (uracil-5-)-methyltransferase RumA [[Clostridium] polysaccharolyticum]
MKKGQVYEGIVEKADFPSKGIVKVEGRKVTVKNTLPGQKIRFSVNKIRNGKAEGRLLEVLEPSTLETREAKCPAFGPCGGCSYQTISYENQLQMKLRQVTDLLNPVVPEYELLGIKGSPDEWQYRNKMEFSFGDEFKDGPLALGLHKRGSFHDIVNARDCKIVHPDYNIILKCILAYFTERNVDFYHRLSHTGCLRHLLVRRAVKTGEILISLVTSSQKNVDLEPLKEKLLSLCPAVTGGEAIEGETLEGRIAGILHIENDSLADVVQSDKTAILYCQDYIMEELLGLKFKISAFSFFQTNSLGAEVLYRTVRDFIGDTKDKLIFDLYSGTGTIAQILAPVAKKVVGVEIVEEAVEAARENAKLNGLDNCEFIAGDVLKMLDTIEDKPDLIVLDPPRDGINPKALAKIIEYGVDRMVYVSCKPTSLARDLVTLQARGYKVEKVCCVDMFPQTVHVETVVLLSKVSTYRE